MLVCVPIYPAIRPVRRTRCLGSERGDGAGDEHVLYVVDCVLPPFLRRELREKVHTLPFLPQLL